MKAFLFLQLWRPACSTERNGLSNFGRGSPKEHSCEIIQNLSTNLAEEVVKSLFLFIALAAILFNVAESFKQFW